MHSMKRNLAVRELRRSVFGILTAFVATAMAVSCASAPAAAGTEGATEAGKAVSRAEPEWVGNPRKAYSEAQYVSAVGYGKDRDSAEKNALGALVSVFGQQVKGETVTTSRYSEAVMAGKVTISEDASVNQAVQTSFDMDTLVGAEIKDTWDDKKGTVYAVAVLDKAKGALLYKDLVESNEKTIAKLIEIEDGEKNTFDAYSRYDLASVIGDSNVRFLNVLSVLSPGMAASMRDSTHTGDEFRLECLRIAKNIPIGVDIADDRDSRISSAFAESISGAGFKTGSVESRYVLRGKLSLNPVELAANTNKFVRYVVDGKLTDTANGTVLFPFNISGREGHATQAEAENRAVRAAEAKIKEEYPVVLSDFMTQLSGS